MANSDSMFPAFPLNELENFPPVGNEYLMGGGLNLTTCFPCPCTGMSSTVPHHLINFTTRMD